MKVWELEEALSSFDKNLEVVNGFDRQPIETVEEKTIWDSKTEREIQAIIID